LTVATSIARAEPSAAQQRSPARGGSAEAALWVRDLVKSYPAGRARRRVRVRGRARTQAARAAQAALTTRATRASDGISLRVARGEIFGLLGPNGAGKTTLVRQLTGLLRPDAGQITLLGHDLVRHPRRAARLLAYLGQESTALDELTVALATETTARLRGLDAAAARRERDDLLDELGLAGLAARPLRRLSGGQRRLACVAAALAGRRPVLVLDEPTAGMDPVARRAVWAALDRRRAEEGTTVLLVTHNVSEAETVLDRVAVLDAGRVIACDTPGGLKELVGAAVRLDLVWREEAAEAPADPRVRALRAHAEIAGRRWTLRLPPDEARAAVAAVTQGPAFAELEDFTLANPSLEDVYLALGGRSEGLTR
jgi:ABC-2 type transport system ATP-binding protein